MRISTTLLIVLSAAAVAVAAEQTETVLTDAVHESGSGWAGLLHHWLLSPLFVQLWMVGQYPSILLYFAIAFVLFSRWLGRLNATREAAEYWQWDSGSSNEEERHRTRINLDAVSFPRGFLWGTATASHQIEGERRTKASAGAAADHWHRLEGDTKLMTELGCNAYRFSLSWNKIEPEDGRFDELALAHYEAELRTLRAAGIEPMITLHHFAHPIWFEQAGAFEHTANLPAFVRFCEHVFRRLSPLCRYWCTINEPEVYVFGGYFDGTFPPGKKEPQTAGIVMRNLLEAHVQVYHALKRIEPKAQIGIVKDVFQLKPFNPYSPFDRLMAYLNDDCFNECILRFFRTGHFRFWLPGQARVSHTNDRATNANDFFGLNYYSHMHVQAQLSLSQPFKLVHHRQAVMTDMPYPLYPEGLYHAVMRVAKLGSPVIITENGISDAVDDRRALFIRRYLYALSRAIKDGADVRGYFYWSLMDNYEWVEGYTQKFGLYHVDFETQKRTLRPGSRAYAAIIESHKRRL